MAIGPNGMGGPPPGMGGGRPPMGGGPAGVEQINANMGRQMAFGRGGSPNQAGGDVDSLMSELMQITQRAEQIISQLESQGVNPEQLLGGGGPQAGPPVGGAGGIPEMPVAANTVPSGGGLLGGVV